jgi:uncharacterized lipoprotein YddW (UPF0748 family)
MRRDATGLRRQAAIIVSAATILGGIGLAASRREGAQTPADVRGLWVTRASLATPQAIDAMVDRARGAGINTLFVQVRGRGEALYQTTIEPRASELAGQPASFDPLARTLDRAHRAGLQVHAWINVNLVSSAVTLPRSANHVIRRHPEWLMVPAPLAASLRSVPPSSTSYVTAIARWTRDHIDRVEGLFLSPVTPASRTYTIGVVRDLVERYPVDGVHFDYIRYPSSVFDYSAAALDAFRRTRADMVTAAERDRLDRLDRAGGSAGTPAWPAMFPESWDAFRRDRLTSLATELARVSREVRPGIVTSAAVLPDPAEARSERLQDWPGWSAAGVLDAVCPMAYTTDAGVFDTQIAAVRTAAGPAAVWAGIGAYRLDVGDTIDRVRAARRLGARGVVLFRYDSVAASDANQATALASLRTVLLESAGRGGRTP